jgi:hypothetical protein
MTLEEKIRLALMALLGGASIAASFLGVHPGLLEIVGGAGSAVRL